MSINSPRHHSENLAGWGNFPVHEGKLYRPEKQRDITSITQSEQANGFAIHGLGRSYGDPAINEKGGVILTTKLNRMLAFDDATGKLTCEAGVSLEDIVSVFLVKGYFLSTTPGTKYVTIGGAIAADVHGKNHHCDGSFSSFVESFDLITADGQLHHCSRVENEDLFWATVGGMGLTGYITQATLQLYPVTSAYVNVTYERATNLDQAFDLFAAGDSDYKYSVAWIDCLASGDRTGRSVLMRGDHAGIDQLPADLRKNPLQIKPKRKKTIPFNMPGFALNPLSVKLFNTMFYALNKDSKQVVDYDSFFYPLDNINHWNRMYGKRGFVQYQCLLPTDSSRAGLREVLGRINASKRASFLAVLKSSGASNEGLLSFPMPGHTLALDLPNTGKSLLDLLTDLDKIVLEHGGRLYLAKDATMTYNTFEKMYPKLEQFKTIKNRVDPEGIFTSSQARRLGLVEGCGGAI